ncbi:MAG: ferritin-like domain-containing protein [Gammaproteobacteria bacterium]|nr:ferritin-like domain-containing protein [Gammaproteobacteria bacterium]
MENLYDRAYYCIALCDPEEKVHETNILLGQWHRGELSLEQYSEPRLIKVPGKPSRPRLVHPRKLPRRGMHSEIGRLALIHAITHIEFNAINLALDAVYRFRNLPDAYYGEWLRVASEESRHFCLLRDHLLSMGYDYGDFDAHNGLWEMALKTSENALTRMALVPRVMEARGLDATPSIIERFKSAGDVRVVSILNIILDEEVGHVEIGTRWFHYCCDQYGLPRQATFEKLLHQYSSGTVKLPLHRKARLQAGFTEAELNYLEGLA